MFLRRQFLAELKFQEFQGPHNGKEIQDAICLETQTAIGLGPAYEYLNVENLREIWLNFYVISSRISKHRLRY